MNGERTRWPALVDSGADHSVLPLGFAVLAEVPFDRSHRVTVEGIGGSAEAFRATADESILFRLATVLGGDTWLGRLLRRIWLAW